MDTFHSVFLEHEQCCHFKMYTKSGLISFKCPQEDPPKILKLPSKSHLRTIIRILGGGHLGLLHNKQKSYKCNNQLITWLEGITRPAGSCNLVTLKTNFAQYKNYIIAIKKSYAKCSVPRLIFLKEEKKRLLSCHIYLYSLCKMYQIKVSKSRKDF